MLRLSAWHEVLGMLHGTAVVRFWNYLLETELLVLMLQDRAKNGLLGGLETAMVDELCLLLSLHLG